MSVVCVEIEILPLLLDQKNQEAMKHELTHVAKLLGEPGASKRTAKLAIEMLAEKVKSDG